MKYFTLFEVTAYSSWSWGPFTNTLRGPDAKNFIMKFFEGPLSDLKKFQPPLFAMKITGQPHRKACNLNFYWKLCDFFQGPLHGSKILRAPFLHQGPLTSVCEWFLECKRFGCANAYRLLVCPELCWEYILISINCIKGELQLKPKWSLFCMLSQFWFGVQFPLCEHRTCFVCYLKIMNIVLER